MNKCEKCGQDLDIVRWSSAKEMVLCRNHKCPAYRNPINPTSKRDWGATFISLTPYNHRITLRETNNYAPEVFVTICGDSRIKPRGSYRQSSKVNRHILSGAVFPASQQISRRVKELFSWKNHWLD
jgi:hypothetical protein